MRYLVGILFCLSIIILSPDCVTSTPRFDAYAYRNSVSLKVDSLQLMAKAGDPYAKHAEAQKQCRRLRGVFPEARVFVHRCSTQSELETKRLTVRKSK